MKEDLSSFLSSVRKLKSPRKHKIKNSYGVYDGFKYYRKTKPIGHKYVLTRSQYFSIVRKTNKLLGEYLLQGEDIKLPYRLGRLEIRKYKGNVSLVNGEIKTNLPIDWNKTLKLWYEDEESYKNKVLVRIEEKEIYKIYYNRGTARFNNKAYYQFNVNRDLKRRLKDNIKEGKIDAFTI